MRYSARVVLAVLLGAFASGAVEVRAADPPRDAKQTAPLPVPTPAATARRRAATIYSSLPLHFEANSGQADAQIQFVSSGGACGLFLAPSETLLALPGPAGRRDRKPSAGSQLRIRIAGASRAVKMAGEDATGGKSNYFLGKERSAWRVGVPHYAKVRYAGVYPGVDLVYHGTQQQLEYDFVVAPRADPGRIRFAVTGGTETRIDERGDLVTSTANGQVRWKRPHIYQEAGGKEIPIAGAFAISGKHGFGFRVARYDAKKPLIIDPILVYATRLGGGNNDNCLAVGVDSKGCAYITGSTHSAGFPTKNSLQPFNGFMNIFVTKIDPSRAGADSLVYSTFLGGTGVFKNQEGTAIAVDPAGYAFVAGYTECTDFPTTQGAFQQANQGRTDAFVVKLNPSGSAMMYSTYLGGGASDSAAGIAIDSAGCAYVAGQPGSGDFPTRNPFQPTNYGGSAYISKLNSKGSDLVYSTFLGGPGANNQGSGASVNGIAVDAVGRAYVTGGTAAPDFPVTASAFMGANVGHNSTAFMTQLNPAGTALLYSTFIGSTVDRDSRSTVGNAIAVDHNGIAYVTGSTNCRTFVMKNAFQSAASIDGDATVFVTKVDPSKFGPDSLVYSTYLGGDHGRSGTGGFGQAGRSIAVDQAGSAYVTGGVSSIDFPVHQTSQPFGSSTLLGDSDAFISKLGPTGSTLIFSTYLGASSALGQSIALDAAGNAYLAGNGALPTTANAFQPSGGTGFLAKSFDETSIGVLPIRGGNISTVTLRVFSHGGFVFQNGATVKVVRAGHPDLVGAQSRIIDGGFCLATLLDLTDVPLGAGDVVVTNPDQTVFTLPGAFTVEEGRTAQPWVAVVGPSFVVPDRPQIFHIVYGNTGNVNARMVPLWIGGIPTYATCKLGFEISPPPQVPEWPLIDWTQVPFGQPVVTPTGLAFPLLIPVIPPGSVGVLDITLTVPGAANGQAFNLIARTNPPFFHSPMPVSTEQCLTNLAKTIGTTAGNIAIDLSGANCVQGIAQTLANGLSLALEINETNVSGSGQVKTAYDLGDVEFGAATNLLTCLGVVVPAGPIANAVIDAIGGLWGFANDVNSCADGAFVVDSQELHHLDILTPHDPNGKSGPQGAGPLQYLSGRQSLSYDVYFENESTATAPAQQVVITDQLDVNAVDMSAFSFGPFSFGAISVNPPVNSRNFIQDVDLRPATNLIVRVAGNVNDVTGLVTWRFTSLDPNTGLLPDDPLVGFLPPNLAAPAGQGDVVFTVQPKSDLATGTVINNQALIIFNTNAPIPTPTWLNTLDNTPPTSQVHALPAIETTSTFQVNWSGSDVGAGVGSYSIYVSDNGGPFGPMLTNTTDAQGTFTGQAGHTYAFYSVAKDAAGNVEPVPGPPVSTSIANYPAPTLTSMAPTTVNAGGGAVTLTLTGTGFVSASQVKWNGSTNLTTTYVSATSLKASVPASLVATAGAATITVFNPGPAGGSSSGLTLNIIGSSQLALVINSITRDAGRNVLVNYTLKNVGTATATSVYTTKATLTGSGGSTVNVPAGPFTLAAGGGSVAGTATFAPCAAGKRVFQLFGSAAGVSFSLSQSVTVP